jgi:hypothetical protein
MKKGHVKNVEAFEKLIGICNSFGAAYKPAKASIKLPVINTLLANARQSLDQLKSAQVAFVNTGNTRAASVESVRKLATRIINALEATDAGSKTIDDGRLIVRRIAGRPVMQRESVPGENVREATAFKSRSHRDATSTIDSFALLVQTVTAETNYKPLEPELQAATLGTTLTTVREQQRLAVQAATALTTARIIRDKVLYNDATSLINSSAAIKKYVKSVFGPTSDQYKQVSAVKIIKYRK